MNFELADRAKDYLERVTAFMDERIYAALLDTLQRTPELGANYLVDYGDTRALAVLAQTFEALPIRAGDNPLANRVFIELRCAIEDLGGHLTAAQQTALETALKLTPAAGNARSSVLPTRPAAKRTLSARTTPWSGISTAIPSLTSLGLPAQAGAAA